MAQVELIIHQTELKLWYFSHDLTWICLLISENLPRFEKVCSTGTKNCFVFTFRCAEQSKMGKYPEINRQSSIIRWHDSRKYTPVWYVSIKV